LKLEVAVLKKLQPCSWVVPFIACGRHADYNFLVMELLGENLAEIRRLQQGRFSMLTTLKLGIQMLRGIEAVHEYGYLHRDIKPSNFAMGLKPERKQTCFLIDFGLARRYMLPNGDIRPPRDMAGFRGTARYASIHSHQSRDLGRRDDLWSLFYLMVESALGQLPWRRQKDKDKVGEMKIKYNNEELVAGLPPEYIHFMNHLQSLQYHTKPDYDFLANMFDELYRKLGGNEKTPFDWDRPRVLGTRKARLLPSLLDHCLFRAVVDFMEIFGNTTEEEIKKLPQEIRKRIFEYILRLNDGKAPPLLLSKFFEKSFRHLDLSRATLSAREVKSLAERMTSLKSLKLSPSNDESVVDFLSKNSELEEIHLLDAHGLTMKGIKAIQACCPKVKVLEISNGDKIGDKSLEFILKQCESLSDLTVKHCKKVKGGVIKTFAGDTGTLRTRKPLPFHITALEISHCPVSKGSLKKLSRLSNNLTKLHLDPLLLNKGRNEFVSLLRGCSRMRSLALTTTGNSDVLNELFWEISHECKQLEFLSIGSRTLFEQQVIDILNSCSSLREIRIAQEIDNGFAATSLPRSLRLLSSLEKVSVKFGEPYYKPSSVSDSAIKGFLHTSTNLVHLSLIGCFLLNPHCFPENCFYPYLTRLDLSDCYQLGDSAIRKAVDCAPYITFFGMNRLNNITKSSLEAIADQCTMMEEVEMRGCVCFSDEELLLFMRRLFKLFLKVTRYPRKDMEGLEIECHYSNAKQTFATFPNTHRDFVFANLAPPVALN